MKVEFLKERFTNVKCYAFNKSYAVVNDGWGVMKLKVYASLFLADSHTIYFCSLPALQCWGFHTFLVLTGWPLAENEI